ncbi:MAG: hypothetical protein K0S33_2390 [Bacteroidetes bacterium]|jgi:hypothetical protein|nr:hypothetical protein [Bacteroidota bacterium]
MKQLLLDIPEKDFDLFVQLLKRFNFKYEEAEEAEVSKEVKRLLDKRKAGAKEEEFLSLTQFKRKFKSKHGL